MTLAAASGQFNFAICFAFATIRGRMARRPARELTRKMRVPQSDQARFNAARRLKESLQLKTCSNISPFCSAAKISRSQLAELLN